MRSGEQTARVKKMKNKNFIIVVVILAVVLLISVPSYLIVPKAESEALVSKLPMQIGEWSGKELTVDERAYEILETKNLILREYTKGDNRVFLYVIYSQDNRKVSHPPEVCFEGSGVTIVKKDKIGLPLADGSNILVNRLVVEKNGASNLVVYWYKAGRRYIDNYMKQQFDIALSRLQFKRTSGALIRLTAEVSPKDPDQALKNVEAFTKEAVPYFDKVMP